MSNPKEWKAIQERMFQIKKWIVEAEKKDIPWCMNVERHLREDCPTDGFRHRSDYGIKMVLFHFGPGVDMREIEEKAKVCPCCGR